VPVLPVAPSPCRSVHGPRAAAAVATVAHGPHAHRGTVARTHARSESGPSPGRGLSLPVRRPGGCSAGGRLLLADTSSLASCPAPARGRGAGPGKPPHSGWGFSPSRRSNEATFVQIVTVRLRRPETGPGPDLRYRDRLPVLHARTGGLLLRSNYHCTLAPIQPQTQVHTHKAVLLRRGVASGVGAFVTMTWQASTATAATAPLTLPFRRQSHRHSTSIGRISV
jgi:hypothetical protein